MNDYYVKMNKRTFTSNTAYSDTGYVWQVPFFGNWRKLRASRNYMFFGHTTDVQAAMFRVYASNNYTVGGLHLGNGIWGSGEGGGGITCCDSLFILLQKNNNEEWVYNRELNQNYYLQRDGVIDDVSSGTIMVQNVYDRGGTRTDGVWANYNDQSKGWFFDETNGDYAEVLDPGDDYFKIKIQMHNHHNQTLRYTYVLNSKNLNHGGMKMTNQTPLNLNTSLSEYISGNGNVGMRFADEGAMTTCAKNFDYLMLGQDSATEANVMKRIEDTIIGTNFWDYGDAQKAEVTFNNGQNFAMFGPTRGYTDSAAAVHRGGPIEIKMTGYGCAANTVKINFPLYPRMKVNDLQNNRWQYQGKSLKISQGLPLIDSIDMKGTLNVKINYIVHNSDGGTPSSDVKLSLKNNDFTTKVDSDYYKTKTGTKVKDLACTGGTIDLDIDATHDTLGKNLWLRIGPSSTAASGLYVNINSIDMKLTTDN